MPLLFLIVFYFYPLASILRVTFALDVVSGDVAGRDAPILAILGEPFVWRTLWFTTWQAAVSTLLTVVIGLPLAFLFARYDFPLKSLLSALTTIPFVMPVVVVAAAFSALLGNTGLINRWFMDTFASSDPPIRIQQTIWMILLAHAFYNVSVVVRTVGGFWSTLNPSIEQAAAVMGANRLRTWWEITLPLLLPSLLAASSLVFLFCFTSFGVVLILGGLRFATLEVEIYRQAVSLFNLPAAAVLSLLQIAITFGIMSLYTRMQQRVTLPLERRAAASRHAAITQTEKAMAFAAVVLVLAALLAPLLTLAARSFSFGEEGLTLRHYAELGVNRRQSAFFAAPVVAVRNSILVAGATVALSLVLGLASAYLVARPRSWASALLEPIFLLPLGTSAVTLGFGYIVSMGALRTSLWLIPAAHTLIASPFVLRTFLPALRSLDPRLHEAAAVLGAGPLRRWREIDAPILLRAALVSAVFAFTISLGEFGATLLISRPDFPTMPVVVYRLLGQPGAANYGQALAMSTIMMGIAGAGLVVIERVRIPGSSEF